VSNPSNHAIHRNNVRVSGQGSTAIVFSHGFGCDQNMWRFVAPAFEREYQVVLFDHVGHGQSDLGAYDKSRYATLGGYADDVLDICAALDLTGAVFVGHSVSSMIGALASIKEPGRFAKLVMVGPSPRYVNDADNVGGFNPEDIEGLLDFLDTNHLGWSSDMAPTIMGNPDRPELAAELANSFCRTDPEIARHFARVTFLSDNRADLASVKAPSLVLQCADDVIAPTCVGEYVHRNIAGSSIVYLRATGHCPNLSAPDETVAAIKAFLATRPAITS
jgi:sigma-B regulation protein RsbQ